MEEVTVKTESPLRLVPAQQGVELLRPYLLASGTRSPSRLRSPYLVAD